METIESERHRFPYRRYLYTLSIVNDLAVGIEIRPQGGGGVVKSFEIHTRHPIELRSGLA